MKRFTQVVCLLLVLSLSLVTPAAAAEVETRSSSYFLSTSCYLWETSNTSFRVWFDVKAVGTMAEIGTSVIKVQRSTDKTNWTTVKTYNKADYSQMIAYNTGYNGSYVTYSGAASGYYYRAYVQFYAKNGSGSGYVNAYTSSLSL